MRHRLVFIALGAALAIGCTGRNECESFADALCGYDSFTTDDDENRAALRKDDCACITKGPDGLETDYKKMNCVARREYLANLDDRAEFAAKTLDACKAARAVLDEYKDRYIEVCVQSGGAKDCTDQHDACAKGCADTCLSTCDNPDTYAECNDCMTACLSDCGYKYPCGGMCSVLDFETFGPGYGGNGGGGGKPDAGVNIPCENSQEGDDCTGGYCVQRTVYMTCSSACPKVGVACAGGWCYWLGLGNACTTPGGRSEGEPCSRAHDCGAGIQCLDESGSSACYKVCNNDNDCDNPRTCVDTELGLDRKSVV